ncbi:MAG: twin-arginine translocase TatA/TatE family subunit [Caulobacteraceae bacterium]|nr:twin-arginine translocase TatA/TatE family subunit [Caulobacteraceae bacterium]
MGLNSPWHWIAIAIVVLVVFGGRGKLSNIMGDAAKGIKAFREGLKDDDKKDGPSDGVSSLPRTDAEKEELKR